MSKCRNYRLGESASCRIDKIRFAGDKAWVSAILNASEEALPLERFINMSGEVRMRILSLLTHPDEVDLPEAQRVIYESRLEMMKALVSLIS